MEANIEAADLLTVEVADTAAEVAHHNGALSVVAPLEPEVAAVSARPSVSLVPPLRRLAPTVEVDVVVIAQNSRAELERSLNSVERAARHAGARMLVVDRGSEDGSLKYALRRLSHGTRGVQVGKDAGLVEAMNVATGCSDADYLVFLPAGVAPRSAAAIGALVEHLERYPSAGVVAPCLKATDGAVHQSTGVTPSFGLMLMAHRALGRTRWGRARTKRLERRPPNGQDHTRVEWARIEGVAIRREIVDRVGGFDEGFPQDLSVLDFFARLRRLGSESHYIPGAAMAIAGSSTNGPGPAAVCPRATLRQALHFYLRHPWFALRPGLRSQTRAVARSVILLRRALEFLAAATLLVLLAPLLALVAVAVRLDSRGPALFRQRRLGQGAQPFEILKFRTMHVDADAWMHQEYVRRMIVNGERAEAGSELRIFKLHPDPRVTWVGRILRRWSLDELPQLWNVLRGEMSLVGFRPPIPYELEYYPAWYHRRFDAKPGITGLWQVSGRNGRSYEDMVALDIEYLNRRTWLLEIGLLLRTVGAVLRRHGAY
jgi:lipopolysaccharide/colanic/teichoic acid biosynthesis glycosyltransferase